MKKMLAAALLAVLVLAGCRISFDAGSQDDEAAEEESLAPTVPGTPEQQKEALAAARDYLRLIDGGQYDATWERAGSGLRKLTGKLMWTNMLKAASKLSLPDERKPQGIGFTTKIDERLPEGDYVTVVFQGTSGKATATERVVMAKEDGAWKLIGYFVNKKAQTSSG